MHVGGRRLHFLCLAALITTRFTDAEDTEMLELERLAPGWKSRPQQGLWGLGLRGPFTPRL